jgi:hypothetical protein
VSLDLDIAVAVDDPRSLIDGLKSSFRVALREHSINIEQPGSDLRAQIQTDPRYAAFVAAAVRKDVLGRSMPVARLEDVLSGKIWAAADPERRGSKRQKTWPISPEFWSLTRTFGRRCQRIFCASWYRLQSLSS